MRARKLPARFRPLVERLEDRTQPTTFTVTTAADAVAPPAGSLRQAILDANANPGPDNIVFAVGTGPLTVSLVAALPAVTSPLLILGNTQPGFTDPSNINPDPFFNTPFPLVTIDGTNAGAGAVGLNFADTSDGSQVQYLQVLNFAGDGMVFDNSKNGLVAYTVVSGNGGNGVLVTGAGATANRFQNMFIGVDKTGNTAVPNGGDGMRIDNLASGNVIGGGNFFQARCIISANLGNGVRITGGAFGNLEQGNVIGLNTGNNKALGNGLDGVLVEGTGAGNIIGGPIGLGGIKSANGRHGVSIMGQSPGTVVFNTFGGISAFSNLDFGNGVDGIHVEASGAGIILTTNITSGNGRYGMYIGGNADGVVVNTLLAGVGFPGTFAITNGAGGVIVTGNAKNTRFGTLTVPPEIIALFGGTAATPQELRNILAGNGGPGIIIEGNATNTRVINTSIGGGLGDIPFPNAGPSVVVRGNATGTVIGDPTSQGPNRVTFDPAGVVVQTPFPVTITRNAIFDITGAGIDTGGQGFAAQARPRLTSAPLAGGGVVVSGSVLGAPNTVITVELFASPAADEGQTFLTSVAVTTNASGIGQFAVLVNPPAGQPQLTATATGANGNTSRFSNTLPVGSVPVVVTGTGSGGGPQVNVFDATTNALKASFFAYDASFRGGVRVATGDVTGDGIADIITAPGAGGGPNVRVFDGVTYQPVAGPLGSFFAYDASFTGGLFVATGDVNGDGIADIVTGVDVGGGPNIRVFSGKTGGLLASFFAFDASFRGGVRVAAGDVTGDGLAEIIAGAGPGGASTVQVFGGLPLTMIGNFQAFAPGFTGGVYVAAGDLSGVGAADIIVGMGAGGSDVRWFGTTGTQRGQLTAFGSSFAGGVRVGTVNRGARTGILAAAGPGGGPQVSVFLANPVTQVDSFFAYAPSFTGGVFVGGSA